MKNEVSCPFVGFAANSVERPRVEPAIPVIRRQCRASAERIGPQATARVTHLVRPRHQRRRQSDFFSTEVPTPQSQVGINSDQTVRAGRRLALTFSSWGILGVRR